MQVSRSWKTHGEQGSLLACLRHCWSQYLEDEGLSVADCPVVNLFSAGDVQELRPAPEEATNAGHKRLPSGAVSSSR